MPYRPVQWARQTVEGRQVAADGAKLVNFYAIRPARPVPEEARVPVMLYGSPGYKRYLKVPPEDFERNNVNVSPQPGIHGLISVNTPQYGEHLFGLASEFQVFDLETGGGANQLPAGYDPYGSDSLVTVNSARIENYTVEDSEKAAGPVKLVSDGRYVMWVRRRGVFVWDVSAGAFVTVPAPVPGNESATLPDEEWVDNTWADGYHFLAARGGQFFHSNVRSLQFDGLDFASAETKPDGIVAIEAFLRKIYIFGSESIERWYHDGRNAPDFAYSRDNGYRHNIGCLNKAGVAATEEELFFIGSDRSVYSIAGDGEPRKVSTESVAYDLKLAQAGLAWGWTYTEEGHRFYSLTLPYADGSRKNWTFDAETRLWHQRTFTDILACARFRGRNLIGRSGSDLVQALDLNFGDADGAAIRRMAISPALHAQRRRVRLHRLDIEVPFRSGGVPEDAIRVSWSDDGQRTWRGMDRDAVPLDRGVLRWNRLGQFHNGRHIRVETSARRRVDLLGSWARTTIDQP